MSNTKNLKVTVPGIWKLKEVIGHDLLESHGGEETGLEQGLRNTVTTLHQYIICTSKVPAKLVQHTHRSGKNRVCVLTKLWPYKNPHTEYFFTFTAKSWEIKFGEVLALLTYIWWASYVKGKTLHFMVCTVHAWVQFLFFPPNSAEKVSDF